MVVGEADASLDLIDHAHATPDEDEGNEARCEDVVSEPQVVHELAPLVETHEVVAGRLP